jgi:hypothetical protein
MPRAFSASAICCNPRRASFSAATSWGRRSRTSAPLPVSTSTNTRPSAKPSAAANRSRASFRASGPQAPGQSGPWRNQRASYRPRSSLRCCCACTSFALCRGLRAHQGAQGRVPGLRQGLTEAERYAVADAVVRRLNEDGDPWKLSEELPEHGTTSAARHWMLQDGGGSADAK